VGTLIRYRGVLGSSRGELWSGPAASFDTKAGIVPVELRADQDGQPDYQAVQYEIS